MKVSYGKGDFTRLLVFLALISTYIFDMSMDTSYISSVALFIGIAMGISFLFGFCTSAFIGEKIGFDRID